MEMTTPPKIDGYRQLSAAEINLINDIKAAGRQLDALISRLNTTDGLDFRWVALGKTDLQTGLMALTRAVARPTTF